MPEVVYDPDEDYPLRTKNVECPECGTQYRFIPDNQKEWHAKKAEDYIQRFQEQFDKTIDNLQEMFPDTPIKEYMEERSKKLRRALSLLNKRLVEDKRLTLEEECELDNIMNNF